MNAFNKKKLLRTLPPALLILLVILTFHTILSNQFVAWDDPQNILANHMIRGLNWANIKAMFTSEVLGVYQPISWLLFSCVYAVFGLHPAGYHLAGLTFHAANTVLVYFLIKRLYSPGAPTGGDSQPGATMLQLSAFFAAALYGLHPLRVEPMAWASGVPYTLAVFFSLLTVLAYLRYTSSLKPINRLIYYLLALSVFACGALSKAIVTPLPVALLLLDIYPLGRLSLPPKLSARGTARQVMQLIAEKIPFLLLSALISIIGIIANIHAATATTTPSPDIFERIGRAFYSIAFHLRLTIMPVNIAPHYWYEIGDISWTGYIVTAMLVILITLLALMARKKAPAIPSTWLAYIILLMPCTGLISHGVQIGANRYTYFSTIPLFLLLSHGITWAMSADRKKTMRIGIFFLMATVLFASGMASRKRCKVWQDSYTFWEEMVESDPRHVEGLNNLVEIILKRDNVEQSLIFLQIAAEADPKYPATYNNLGEAYTRAGETRKAIEAYQKALNLDLDNIHAREALREIEKKRE
jgi:hypothetical protein